MPSKPPENCKRVVCPEKGDRLEPAFPYRENLSTKSLLRRTLKRPDQVEAFLNRRVIYQDMGEWPYPLKDGSLQIFPANACQRRWSLDEQDFYHGLLSAKSDLYQANCEIGSQIEPRKSGGNNYSYWLDSTTNDRPNSDREYYLKDGSKVIFDRSSLHNKTDNSPGQLRRFSFDDRDTISPYIYRTRSRSPTSGSTTTMSSGHSSQRGKHKHSCTRSCLKAVLRLIAYFTLSICCFVCIGLRARRRIRQRRGSRASISPPPSISGTPSTHEQSKRPRWKRIMRQILGFFILLIYAPCCITWLYHDRRRERKEQIAREIIQRREVFEAAYIRRHGRHSEAYLESKFVRDWWVEEEKNKRNRKQTVFRIIKKNYV